VSSQAETRREMLLVAKLELEAHLGTSMDLASIRS